MTYQPTTPPNLDSFERLRVSEAISLFDAQLTYDLAPLVYEAVTNGPGAVITHDTTNRMGVCTFSSTPTGGKAYLQTYEYFRYEPGKSQLILMSFLPGNGVANVKKFAQYGDDTNAVGFRLNGTTPEVYILSGTSLGNEVVTQSNWNYDKFDGSGRSGITLNPAATILVVIDLQALYVGTVRIGFEVNGKFYLVHQFHHSNLIAYPYIQSANLPVRMGMECTGTVTATFNPICCTVQQEAGQDPFGYAFSIEGVGTAGNGSFGHILSVRPKQTFNSITNRTKFILDSFDISVTGSNPINWQLCVGQALSASSYSNVNATYSAYEYAQNATLSGSPAIVIAQGYLFASATSKGSVGKATAARYPISLNAAGAVSDLRTLTLIASGISGTSATRCTFNFREVR